MQVPLTAIEETARSVGMDETLMASTDAYVTSICYLGSKSLSHVLSQIERCKERLLLIGTQSESARRQIITSVMEYWHEKPGVGVNMIDKLLNYTILTPMSVITWALSDQLGKGEGLVLSHVFEMVSSTVTKVTNRVRQIVFARNQPALPADQAALLDETLAKERVEMGKLFALIEDALIGVASGSVDAMAESADQDLKGETMLRGWGGRWLRVFRRKMAVEEAWVQEMLDSASAVEAMEGVDNDTTATKMEDGGGTDVVGNGASIENIAKDEGLDEIM